MGKTLYDKVWDRHEVTLLEDGRSQLFIGLHLVHEVTSPQAFGMLKEKGLKVAFPERTYATSTTLSQPMVPSAHFKMGSPRR